jgi:hypothetical protein
MNTSSIRQAVLPYLDNLPENASIQPTSLAHELQLQPSDVNAFILAAQTNDEIEVLKDGSIKISPRLRGQMSKYRRSENTPTPVPLLQWGIAQNWEKMLTLLSSIVFIVVLLISALSNREIPDRQYVILRTILALSGAGFVMAIPGFISADVIFKHLRVRAVGAFAVFVILYFVLPAT